MMMGRDRLGQFLEEIALMTDIDTAAQVVDQVKLMTIHSSKGLEFPVVFVVGVEEGNFPGMGAKMDPDEMEEERRLMYVAITRAKDTLFLTHAQSRQQRWKTTYGIKPSRFIQELPAEYTKVYDLTKWSSKWPTRSHLNVGDIVASRLFGRGKVLEVRSETIIVHFDSKVYGIRKMDARLLEKVG